MEMQQNGVPQKERSVPLRSLGLDQIALEDAIHSGKKSLALPD
jgi:hypothetical protein